MPQRVRDGFRPLVLLGCLPAAFLAILFLWPLGALVRRAIDTAGEPVAGSSAVGVVQTLSRTHAGHLLLFTLGQAAASTVLTIVVALPIIWLVARVRFVGSRLLTVLVTVPFVLPTVVVGVIFRTVFDGPLAAVPDASGLIPILAAHIFLNVAVVVRVVAAAWQGLDARVVEAARTLGATRMRAFATVTAPRLLPALAGAAALVFLFCSTSFGVIIILGNGQLQTLETEIYTRAIDYFQISDAVVLSVLQIVVVLAALGLVKVFGSTGSGAADGEMTIRRPSVAARPHGIGWAGVGAASLWTLLWLAAPLAVLIGASVHPDATGGWTLAGYRALSDPVNGITPLDALRYSALSAAAAAVLAIVVGLAAAVVISRAGGVVAAIGNAVATLPLGISAVTLGFGYLIVLSTLPRQLSASPLIIPAVQALIAVPVVIRIVVPALARVPRRTRQAAMTLGASPFRAWLTVDLPVIARSLGAAGGFAFVMALGEFGATSFLARPDTTTLPVLIGSALNKPGPEYVSAAMACAVVMVAATVAAVALIEFAAPAERTGL